MTRRLKNIKSKELSFVEKAANKRTFLFFKSRDGTPVKGSEIMKKLDENITVEIDSDGTSEGTKVSINGSKLKLLKNFSFSFWDSGESPVQCSYSKAVESKNGFDRTETFYLAKGARMHEDITKLLKDYFGDDFKEEDFAKAEAQSDVIVSGIKSALTTLNQYKEDFPEDLKKANGVLARYASQGYCHPIQKSDESDNSDNTESDNGDAEASTIKKSKAEKIVEAIQKALLPEDTNSESDSETSELKTAIAELTKAAQSFSKANKNKNDDEESKGSEVTDAITKLTTRIETVEKARGVKKSVEGQDDDDGDEDTGKLWPSFDVSS